MAKILVADDEADLEMLIKQKFRQKIREQQYEFIFAINGNDALEKIVQHPDIDIVLSDINMPEMDGFEATRQIIAHENSRGLPHTPIIAMTANAIRGDREACLEAGMDDYVAKPFLLETLCASFDRWLPGDDSGTLNGMRTMAADHQQTRV